MTSVLIAGASTNSGKTIITASILRALKNRGLNVRGGKIGPDYIDPKFHAIASDSFSLNVDAWAMNDNTLHRNLATMEQDSDITIIEGVMGLFDGASDGSASSAEVAKKMGLPIILCLDVWGQSQSISAIVNGFDTLDEDIKISGIILTRIGTEKHLKILKQSLQKYIPHIPLIGTIFRNEIFELESRHLGLVHPSSENDKTLNKLLDKTANIISQQVDLDKLISIGKKSKAITNDKIAIPKFSNHIAVSYDKAFSFCYPHIINSWKKEGAKISFFSPLNDEAPDENASSIYLCGGYPELYCETLAKNKIFKLGMLKHAEKGTFIFGECGGFMTLGKSITDKNNVEHKMLGLLDLKTSFAKKKLHLSYQNIKLLKECNLGTKNSLFKGHEFHYATITHQSGEPLFEVNNACNSKNEIVGLVNNNVIGSFIHLFDKI